MLQEVSNPAITVLVVWEPVLWTDVAPPISSVLARVTDSRAVQFWDEGRTVSASMLLSPREDAPLPGEHEAATPETILWDLVAVYPPGPIWSSRSPPAYSGGPVGFVMDEVREAIRAPGP